MNTDRPFFIHTEGNYVDGFIDFWGENSKMFGFERQAVALGAGFCGLTLEAARKNLKIIEDKFPEGKFVIDEKSL